MSATSITVSPAQPPAAASSALAALPVDLSHSPVLGIVGVILGAGIVTIAGRLLTLGLADLKGGVGIGFDQGAWIPSAFNVALMFIGPFSVYLGGLLGIRKVLLYSAVAFTVISAFLPLVHNYGLMIGLLVAAGLTSGTFYPLTLTFALKNIPLRYLALVIALYGTCIEGAVNFAPSVYGFCRNDLSWHWIFWIPALTTPVMMACIYFGIPPSPKAQSKKQPPSFTGFFFLSAGFALLYAALDQGQRLDWWRSGTFTALFASAIFVLLCSLLRHFRSPNFLVDLPYLRDWNTILLAVALFAFRFALLATVIIIPQSLSVRGLEALQYGPSVLWTANCELFLAFVGALLLSKGFDSRLLMAVGFAAMAFACLINANFTSAWAPENYFRSELLMGVGQSFAIVGLVASLVLQAAFSGGLSAPQRALTFAAFFHTVRLLGGEVGAAFMGHFIANREKLHSNLLGLHVQSGSWVTDENLHQLAAGLSAKSNGLIAATGRAAEIIGSRLRLQAYSLTFLDAFHLVAWVCVGTLLLTALLRKARMNFAQVPLLQQAFISNQRKKP
jgi:MFS transporter, DHA2 family, multidrug resistance protein